MLVWKSVCYCFLFVHFLTNYVAESYWSKDKGTLKPVLLCGISLQVYWDIMGVGWDTGSHPLSLCAPVPSCTSPVCDPNTMELPLIGTVAQWDWNTMRLEHNGTGTHWNTMGLEHSNLHSKTEAAESEASWPGTSWDHSGCHHCGDQSKRSWWPLWVIILNGYTALSSV